MLTHKKTPPIAVWYFRTDDNNKRKRDECLFRTIVIEQVGKQGEMVF
jgi:hypothetical protein